MIQLRKDVFSNNFSLALRVSTVLGLVVAHYFQGTIIYYFTTSPHDSKWLLTFLTMHFTVSATIYKIIYGRKKLRRLVFEMSEKLRQLNAAVHASTVTRFKLWLTLITIFVLSQLVCITYLRLTEDNNRIGWIETLSFNTCHRNTSCLKVVYIVDGFVYVIFSYGLISTYNLIYCFMAKTIGISVEIINNKIKKNQNEISNLLCQVNRDFHQLKDFVCVINSELQFLVLVWLLIVFVMSCNGLLNLITLPYGGLLQTYHQCFLYFHLLALFFSIVFMAARLEKEVERTRSLLDEISWLAISHGLAQEVHVIRKMASQRNMILKAGDCFLITSKLFVSYIGFALTYVVVIIQINPRALKIIQNMFYQS